MHLTLGFALVLVGASALLGLATVQLALLAARVAKADPVLARFPGELALIENFVWRGGMTILMAFALERLHRAPVPTVRAMWSTTYPQGMPTAVAVVALAACFGVAVMWSRLPVIGRLGAASPEAYGHRYPPMTRGRLAASLLIRYPMTVAVEETFFRGFLQRELPHGLVVASLFFAAYHLQQYRTIPSLVPYEMAGGILYAWTGTLWAPAIVHYCLDSGYALMFPRSPSAIEALS